MPKATHLPSAGAHACWLSFRVLAPKPTQPSLHWNILCHLTLIVTVPLALWLFVGVSVSIALKRATCENKMGSD